MKKILLFLITVFLAYLTAYHTTGKKNGYTSPFNFSWTDSLNAHSNSPETNPRDFPDYVLINDPMRRGYENFLQEDYSAAAKYFEEAANEPESETKALLMLGRVYAAKEDKTNAAYYFDRAIAADPKEAEAYYRRGVIKYADADYQEAVNDFYMANELNYNSTKALYYLSLSYENLNNTAAALQAALDAFEKDSSSYDACFQAGRMYYAAEQYQNAVNMYNKVLEIKPGDKYSLLNKALAFDASGAKDSALIAYNKVPEIDPDYALAYNNRGWYYQKNEQYDLALLDYNRALETDNTYQLPLWNRADLYYTTENYEAALDDYLRLLEINSNNYSALYYAGLCFEKLNQNDSASKYFRSFVNSESENYELKNKAEKKLKNYR